jgi:hypothetical protein
MLRNDEFETSSVNAIYKRTAVSLYSNRLKSTFAVTEPGIILAFAAPLGTARFPIRSQHRGLHKRWNRRPR